MIKTHGRQRQHSASHHVALMRTGKTWRRL
jgi:hypothetical protein